MEIERDDNLFFNYSPDKSFFFVQPSRFITILTLHNLQIRCESIPVNKKSKDHFSGLKSR